jgi:hypothetical protein
MANFRPSRCRFNLAESSSLGAAITAVDKVQKDMHNAAWPAGGFSRHHRESSRTSVAIGRRQPERRSLISKGH